MYEEALPRYDFAPDPIRISLYMRKILFSFLSVLLLLLIMACLLPSLCFHFSVLQSFYIIDTKASFAATILPLPSAFSPIALHGDKYT